MRDAAHSIKESRLPGNAAKYVAIFMYETFSPSLTMFDIDIGWDIAARETGARSVFLFFFPV